MNTILLLNKQPPSVFTDSVFQELSACLSSRHYELLYPDSKDDLLHIVKMDARVCAVVYDLDTWTVELAKKITEVNELLPIFAMVDRKTSINLSYQEAGLNMPFFEYRLETGKELSARIHNKIKEYKEKITPPFTKALINYVREKKYSLSTPGHLGGAAFQKSPVGTIFYDFLGPNIFMADVSVSMTELGSLLEHTGPHKEAEDFIEKSFGSDASYIVTNGTSTANKMVGMFCTVDGDTIIVDRNCHKSITHLMMMVDVEPIYLKPSRNAYGILGGIPKKEFLPASIEEKMKRRNLTRKPKYIVITNSTYDGIFYNVNWIKEQEHLKYVHFDSAWTAYTAFHPIYDGKHGMTGNASPASLTRTEAQRADGSPLPSGEGQVIFETQSTHKLLAALSQVSMIHAKGQFDRHAFNEVYMMHTSTSPQYSLVASAEIAAAMMRGNSGHRLIRNSIERALKFRKEIKRLKAETNSWFFDVWQPEDISNTPECWTLAHNEEWHGFPEQDDDFNYLDPVKVTILTPGMEKNGQIKHEGIPACIVAEYLNYHGEIVEKTGPYNMLFLFSIGVDEPKSIALLHGLSAFKTDYDSNLSVEEMLPEIYQKDPHFYRNMRIQELAGGIHQLMVKHNLPQRMYHAFDILPEVVITPHKAFQKVLIEKAEEIYIEDLLGRVNADMILPYPPGVPLLMPGEMITKECQCILDFLLMLCEIGEKYPGFETEIHGAYRQDDGRYKVKVLKE
jgi:lysine decarboxylase